MDSYFLSRSNIVPEVDNTPEALIFATIPRNVVKDVLLSMSISAGSCTESLNNGPHVRSSEDRVSK